MEFRKVLALRGPNVWANFPVLEAWVDLGVLKDSPSDELPGFNDRLKAWLPSMIEHRCSVGERGGFFERLRRGTYQAHILEHVTLELQCLAGTPVGFGRARETATDGVYKVVVEYESEQLARAALQTGRRLCLAAVYDQPFDVQAEIEALRDLLRRVAPKPETAALVQAAKRRRIPVRFLHADSLLQLGHGVKQHRLQGSQTDRTSATADSIARDNCLTRDLLQAVGVPVPPGDSVTSAQEAWEAAEDVGLPVSVRPRRGTERRPEWARLETREQVTEAYRAASDGDDPVLVERVLSGAAHSLLVAGGRVVAAVRRDEGGPVEVSAHLHAEVAARAAEAARVVGLDVAGVEVIAEDVGRPLEAQGGAVLAVHAHPDLNEFLRPASGEPRPVADAILATLFPEGEDGRIPLVSITGTNGKTTTTRLIAHILGRVHAPVGMACSEGIYVGDRLLEAGDCSGPNSARAVLQHPDVRAAVLETARGGILREGLGFDRCHVAVITNIARGDHLGLNDIHTPEQVAKVKRTPVDVVLPHGAAVLNATDPLVAGMAEHCRGGVIYFARDGGHAVIVAHRAAGKRAVFARDGKIVLAEGGQETQLVPLDRVPLTHGGRVGFNVENALAAAAAAWAVGVPLEQIRAGLETFGSVLEQVPCRFNLLEYKGATVILDYAHNISALETFLEVLRQFPHRKRTAVYAVPGDRSDEVIVAQGELLGAAYDRVIIYEDTELRGRKDGEIFALIRQGLAKHGRTGEVLEIRGNLKAIQTALAVIGPGELLVVQPEFPDVGAEYFSRLTGAGAREITLDRALAGAAEQPADVRFEGRVVK
jgi:cyanophycin synthetase